MARNLFLIALYIISWAAFSDIFFPQDACAFTVNFGGYLSGGTILGKKTVGWQADTVTLDIDSSCSSSLSEVQSAVGSALNLWNGVPSTNLTVKTGTTVQLPLAITSYVGTSPTALAPVGNPIIVCEANFSADTGLDPDSIPGFAGALNVDPTSGKMLGALLVLNIESSGTASITNLAASLTTVILAHEIGHILGLGHSADTNALMYYSVTPDKVAALAQDDVDGITYLYPREEPTGGKAFGCGSLASGRGISKKNRSKGSEHTVPPGAAEIVSLFMICAVFTRVMKSSNRYSLRYFSK